MKETQSRNTRTNGRRCQRETEYNLVWSCVAGGFAGVGSKKRSVVLQVCHQRVRSRKVAHAACVVGIDAEEVKGEDEERSAWRGSK